MTEPPDRIAEFNILERNSSLAIFGKFLRVLWRADFLRRIQQFCQALGRSGGLLYFTPDLGKLPQRAGGKNRVEYKLTEPPSGDVTRKHLAGTEPENADNACENEKYRDCRQTSARAGPLTGGLK